jgi:hypothetical protein
MTAGGVYVRTKDATRKFVREVWYTGSDALLKGEGLCYERDYTGSGTGDAATDTAGERDARVERPSTDNNEAFAGVTKSAYNAVEGGQWIKIYEPGSVCEILVGAATVLNTTRLNCCIAGSVGGIFAAEGFPGRGQALALETTPTASSTITSGVIVSDFSSAGAFTAATNTLADTGAFANVVAGDKVFIFGGAVAADTKVGSTPGWYTVVSRTDDTAVLDGAAGLNNAVLTYCVVRNYHTVLAYLLPGPDESGLCEFVETFVGASGSTMSGGVSLFTGGYALTGGPATGDIADGLYYGQRKGFQCLAALATSDVDLDFSTPGIQRTVLDGTTTAEGAPLAMAAFTMDGAGDTLIVDWWGQWIEKYASAGITLATS